MVKIWYIPVRTSHAKCWPFKYCTLSWDKTHFTPVICIFIKIFIFACSCLILYTVSSLANSVKILYSASIYITYALSCYVIYEIIWINGMKSKFSASRSIVLWEYLVRTGIALVTCKLNEYHYLNLLAIFFQILFYRLSDFSEFWFLISFKLLEIFFNILPIFLPIFFRFSHRPYSN